jgi:hypothetical protein
MALAAVFFFGVPERRRKLKTLLALLLFAIVAGTGIGCGAKSPTSPPVNNPPANPGTTPGDYVVRVTATSGAITDNTTFNVTVN